MIIENLEKIAGLLSLAAYGIYIISTIKGETKPSRSTWWILTFVGIVIMWSSYALGSTDNLWIQMSYVIGPGIIAFLSLKYGDNLGFERLDWICLIGAFFSIILWIVFNSPLVALLGSIVVDAIGLIPTVKKSYINPKEEDPTAWSLEMFASILNAMAIGVWFQEDKSWIYATYLVLMNATIFVLLVLRPWYKSLVTKKSH
jgi:hypothetical protein